MNDTINRLLSNFARFWKQIYDRLTKEGEMPDQDIQQHFAEQVRKASALLDFLLDEGHPYHIPDQIIDAIEAARELLKDPQTLPTPEARAKLEKAYRDLVNIPPTPIATDGMPPIPFWQNRRWLWALGLICGLPTLIIIVTYVFTYSLYSYMPYVRYITLYPFISGLAIWACYVFTGVAFDEKLKKAITFCYVFTGLALFGSILPFFIPNFFPEPSVAVDQGKAAPMGAPIKVLRGCGEQRDGAFAPPEEVKCADGKIYQWVVSIGGVIDHEFFTITAPQSTATTPPQSTATTPPDPSGLVKKFAIRGGLVVPLYVLVLALIGGAVSMTRRVPEYQRRAMSTQEPLTNEEAREDLVFQIMQVFTAPLIAIVTYYIVDPKSTMWSVVLGFGSGFASEPILLMIRSLVEKLSPAAAPSPSAIVVRVNPATATVARGESKQFTASVTGTANSQLNWSIDPAAPSGGTITQSGFYSAPAAGAAVPAGTVTIIATSVADPTKSGRASVTVT